MSGNSSLLVHLVGSVPLDTADDVLKTVSASVGPYLKRLPDGETGTRRFWIGHISGQLNKHPMLEIDQNKPPMLLRLWNGEIHREVKQLKFKDGVDPSTATFATGYGDMGIESFARFDKLQSNGVIPKGVRFQIAIPTPLAPALNYITSEARPAFLKVYTRHILDEVAKIAKALPNDRVAIQWDVLQEILLWEHYYDEQPSNYKDMVLSSLAEIGNAVPEPIELGYHFCYGSPHDEHLVQPKDCAVMTVIANGIAARLSRPFNFLHLPVPKDRSDEAYFRPLADLKLGEETELYIGMVHGGDDAGNRKRLAVAQQFVKVAGVATECGWGRKNPETVPGLLEAHRVLCAG